MMQINTGLYTGGYQPTSKRQQQKPIANVIQFSGKLNKSKKKRSKRSLFATLGLVLTGLAAPLAAPAPAAAQTNAPDTTQVVVYDGDQVCINDHAITHIDSADQLSELNQARNVDFRTRLGKWEV